MKDGQFTELYNQHVNERDELLSKQAEELKKLDDKYEADRTALEEQCVREHGSHKDAGGMFYFTCTRCGAGD